MKHCIIGLLMVVSTWLTAQQTAVLSINIGGATYLGDLEPEDIFPSLDATQLSLGLNAGIPLRPCILLRGNISFHSLAGSDARNPDTGFLSGRGFSFTNQLLETSVHLVWEPFAKKRYPTEGGYKNIVSPYLFVGGGVAFFNPKTNYNEPLNDGYIQNVAIDKEAKKGPAFVMPFGGGLRFDLSNNMSLGLELGARKTNTDYLDGVSASGAINTDWYISGGVTLAYRWFKPDYDRDGFMDIDDLCPMKAGVDYTQGCPDADGDQIPDHLDKCPYQVGKAYADGCPDSDYDGVADFLDKCPEIPGHASGQGCIDSDGDSIIDDNDMCPNCAGSETLSGCPDADGDGVEDSRDRCPNMKGSLASGGCPFMDQDLDGVPDKSDQCPNIKGLKQFDGCPDTDGDGLIDSQDTCPELAGTLSNNGCPEVTEEIKATLAIVTKAVQFETGSNQLKDSSKETLQKLIDILNAHPYYHLSIAGHTDSQGKASSNLRLSQKRAEACYNFLLENEVITNRLTHQGFGEAQPIDDNNTREGRAKNRRVVFDLFVP